MCCVIEQMYMRLYNSLCLWFMDALGLEFLRTLSTGYQNPISIIISVLCSLY